MSCPRCERPTDPADRFCRACGAAVAAAPARCRRSPDEGANCVRQDGYRAVAVTLGYQDGKQIRKVQYLRPTRRAKSARPASGCRTSSRRTGPGELPLSGHDLTVAARLVHWRGMHTEIWESDAFSPRKGKLLATIDSDYRWENQDELTIEVGGDRARVRVIGVRISLADGKLSREILALPL